MKNHVLTIETVLDFSSAGTTSLHKVAGTWELQASCQVKFASRGLLRLPSFTSLLAPQWVIKLKRTAKGRGFKEATFWGSEI